MNMRTLISDSILGDAWRAWNQFWFEPSSTVTLGLLRICYGALVLAFIALLLPDIFVFFSEGGPLTPQDAQRFWGTGPQYSPLLRFPQPLAVAAFFTVFSLAAFALMIGLWSRLSAILVFFGLVSLTLRNPFIMNGGDNLIRLMGFYLALSPCGAALSVDRLRGLAKGTEPARSPLAPPWPLRLLQLHVCFIYAVTILLKLKGTAWPDGTALYYTSRLEDFHRFPLPYVFDSMLLINAMTYWTVAVELALAFLIWVPRLRVFVLLNGLLLHLGIEYTMNIPLFAATMLTAYIAFVDVEGWWERLRATRPLRGLARGTLDVRGRPATRGLVPVLRAMDISNRLEAIEAGDPRRDRAAHLPLILRTADGHIEVGAAAWRWLAWRLPPLWPAAPFLSIPRLNHRVADLLQAILSGPATPARTTTVDAAAIHAGTRG